MYDASRDPQIEHPRPPCTQCGYDLDEDDHALGCPLGDDLPTDYDAYERTR